MTTGATGGARAAGDSGAAVADASPALVAVGYQEGPGTRGGAAVWTSRDALLWSRVPDDQNAFGEPSGALMRAVTAGGPGLVAVGDNGSLFVAQGAARVWTSDDGRTWRRVPHDESVFGGPCCQRMSDVVASPRGIVSVGSDASSAAVWFSPNGLAWRRVPHDESAFGGSGSQSMSAVTAGGPGFVAGGTDLGAGDRGAAAIWISSDGLTWSRVRHDESVFGGPGPQAIFDVAAGGPGLVAVGYDEARGRAAAAIWTSSDGLVWRRVRHDESVFGGDVSFMRGVTAGGPGVVAVGFDTGNAAIWTSRDGLTWRREPHRQAIFGDADLTSVAAGGLGVVAVGYDASGIQHAAVWTSPDGVKWNRVAHDEAVFGAGRGSTQVMTGVVQAPGLAAFDGREIAERYAPFVYLHSGEQYWPMSARAFVARSSLEWKHIQCERPHVIAARGSVNQAWLGDGRYRHRSQCSHRGATFRSDAHTRPYDPGRGPRLATTREEGFYLDAAPDDAVWSGNRQAIVGGRYSSLPVYFDYEPGRFLTYWFFYGRSAPGVSGGSAFSHEGDWERVTVRLDPKTNRPTFVAFYQHDFPPKAVRWAAVDRQGTHPIVFSARGGHASYPTAGKTQVCFPDSALPCASDERDKGWSWPTWKNLQEIRVQPWCGFGGAWGDRGLTKWTTGGVGPSPYKERAPGVKLGSDPCP